MTTEIPTSQKELTINAKEPDKELTTINLELNAENGSSDKSESQVEVEYKAGANDVELDHSKEIINIKGNTIVGSTAKDRNKESNNLENKLEEEETTAPVEPKDIESTSVHGEHVEDNYIKKMF